MNIVCEVCGDIGFRHILLCCRDCKCSAVHQYCLEKVVFDASLLEWFCYECLQKRSEITCVRSVEKVPSERPPSHAHFGSIVHQPISKRVESTRDSGAWKNRKSKSFVTIYASLNKKYPSQKKRTKNKSNMRPMGNCTNRGRIDKISAHTSAKASYSCEIIETESAKSNNGNNQQVDHENPGTFNIKQPSPLIVNCLGTSGDTDQSHMLETMEELARKSKKTTKIPTAEFKGLVMNRENVVLRSNKLGSSCSTAELGNLVLEKSRGKSNSMKDSGGNHDNQTNQHASVGCKNMEVKSVKDKETVVAADQNKYGAVGSLRNSMDKSEVHGDSNSNSNSKSNSNIIDGLMPEREKEEIRFQLDYRAKYELPQRSIAANVPQLPTLQNDAVDKVTSYSANDGCEELFSCRGIKNIPSVRERSVDSVDISSISQHDTTEASESSESLAEHQKGSSCRHGKTLKKMAAASSSSEESGYNIIQIICIFASNYTSLIVKLCCEILYRRRHSLRKPIFGIR
ncbi:hypothetical protein PVAP13_9NG206000 [Panicum virgatum]|uniref:PHD-type domain-containing protein n=1 Tax=Panicum virgatum TaxID=38727 RepID=A0A8T0MKI1_PANVG|nr:hypothetical protein PVAP13_9NG206000 [Panicum virgatum]KAG2536595.1 hypothetical protein PVAP13_9NG206000 [Panicum virgatum]